MLEVGKQYEDLKGPYEVLEVAGDKARIRYFAFGGSHGCGKNHTTAVVIARIKYEIHLKTQAERAAGNHPRWAAEYEQMFEAALKYGGVMCFSGSDKYRDLFIGEYEHITGKQLVEDGHGFGHRNGPGTSYQITFPEEMSKFVPGEIGQKNVHWNNTTNKWFNISNKVIFFELLKRGFVLGSNHAKT